MAKERLTPKISSIVWHEVTSDKGVARPYDRAVIDDRFPPPTTTTTTTAAAESWWPLIFILLLALLLINCRVLWRTLRPETVDIYWRVFVRNYLRRHYARYHTRFAPRVEEALCWIKGAWAVLGTVSLLLWEAVVFIATLLLETKCFLVSMYEGGPRTLLHLLRSAPHEQFNIPFEDHEWDFTPQARPKHLVKKIKSAPPKPKQHLKFTEEKNWHFSTTPPASPVTETPLRTVPLYNATYPSPEQQVITLTEKVASLEAKVEDKEGCNRALRGKVHRKEETNNRLWHERKTADELYARERKEHAGTRKDHENALKHKSELDMKLKKSALLLNKEKKQHQELKSQMQLAELLKADCPELDDEPLFSLDPEMGRDELMETCKKHLAAQSKKINRRWTRKWNKANTEYVQNVALYNEHIESIKAELRVQANVYETEIERLNGKIKAFKDDVPAAMETYKQLTLDKYVNVPLMEERIDNLKVRWGLARMDTVRAHKRSLAITDHLKYLQDKRGKEKCCHIADLELELKATEMLDNERQLRMDERTKFERQLAESKAQRVWLAAITGRNIEGSEEQWKAFSEIMDALIDADVDSPEGVVMILKNHAEVTRKNDHFEALLQSERKHHEKELAKTKATLNHTSIQARHDRYQAKQLLDDEKDDFERKLEKQRAEFKEELDRERAKAQLERNMMQEDLDRAREERNNTDAQLVECQAHLASAQQKLSARPVPGAAGKDKTTETKVHDIEDNRAAVTSVPNPFATIHTPKTADTKVHDIEDNKVAVTPVPNPFATINTLKTADTKVNSTNGKATGTTPVINPFTTTRQWPAAQAQKQGPQVPDCAEPAIIPQSFTMQWPETQSKEPKTQVQDFAKPAAKPQAFTMQWPATETQHSNAPAPPQTFTMQWPIVQAQDRAFNSQNQTSQPWKPFQPQDLNPFLHPPQSATDQEHHMPDAEELTADEEELLDVFDMGQDDNSSEPPTASDLMREFEAQEAAAEAESQDQAMGGTTEELVADSKLEQELHDEFGSPPHSPEPLPSPPRSSPCADTKAKKEDNTSEELLKEVGQEIRMSKTVPRRRGIRGEPTKAQKRAAPWLRPIQHNLP